jgi:hypothetical protein
MNIMLWVLQVLLALYNLIGGIYVAHDHGMIANAWALKTLPGSAWIALGILQVLFALGLVLPAALRVLPKLTAISAACLALISLSGSALYVEYAGFPGVLWALLPAILSAFVAYGRMR